MSEQQIIEQIKDGVQRLVDGKMDRAEFQEFIKTSNTALDQLMVEKAVVDERRAWEDLNWRTMY